MSLTFGIHIFDPSRADRLFKLLSRIICNDDKVIVTTHSDKVEAVQTFSNQYFQHNCCSILCVSNKFHDWSGYLEILSIANGEMFIFANDSLVTRHFPTKFDLTILRRELVSAQGPALIGELDCARNSLLCRGRTANCWISTYLFGLKCPDTFPKILQEELLVSEFDLPENTKKSFEIYLMRKRPEYLLSRESLKAKTGAMNLELQLTEICRENRYDIVNLLKTRIFRRGVKFLESRLR